MRKIQTKITVIFVVSIVIVSMISGAVGILVTRYSTTTAIRKNLTELPVLAAQAAQNSIATYTTTVLEIASNSILSDEAASLEQKAAFLQERVDAYYMHMGGLADTSGYDAINGVDVSQEPFFQRALSGEVYMSPPYIDESTSGIYLAVSAPVKRNGAVAGVVYFMCDNTLLQGIVENLQVGENGVSYILDKTGTIIAYPDESVVSSQVNNIQQYAANPGNEDLAALVEIEKKMVAGETGIGSCYYPSRGMSSMQSYTPIPGTDGWSVCIVISENEFMRSATIGAFTQAGIALVLIAVALAAALLIGRSIVSPIVKCTDRLERLAEGDLASPVPQIDSKDETRILADSTAHLVQIFGQIGQEMGVVLGAISNGDLTKNSVGDFYPGDLAALQRHMRVIVDKLNRTMRDIVNAADQVSSSSDQVASTGTLLAQGAADQAGAVEKLSATIMDMSSNAQQTAHLAEEAKGTADSAGVRLQESSQYIASLNEAMGNITDSASEIGRIIATIENIAFQTNILALNAAVEAARAGAAGKGFAVVADEVRNLAAKSDEAAKATKELIGRAIAAVNTGSLVAGKVTESVSEVIELASGVVGSMGAVAQAVEQQTAAIDQVRVGIDQISGVVQSNSATAEESAATSKELSNQAEELKTLVDGFTLLPDHGAGGIPALEQDGRLPSDAV